MPTVTRFVVVALCALGLVTLAAAGGGCSSGDEKATPTWETVTSAQVSGDKPVKLSLGTHDLGTRVRLAWELSGPEDPPVTLTLRIIDTHAGIGVGRSVAAKSEPGGIERQDDNAITLTIGPGEYRMFFVQRFPPAKGPGYDIKLTVYTLR